MGHDDPTGERLVAIMRPHVLSLYGPFLVLLVTAPLTGLLIGLVSDGPRSGAARGVLALMAALALARWVVLPSMLLAGAASVDRSVVLVAYLRALATTVQPFLDSGGDPRAGGLAAAYRELCDTLGRRVRLHLPDGAHHVGTAVEVDDAGALLVRQDDGTVRAFAAGDVVHLRAGH